MTEIFAETFLVYIKNIAVDKTRIEKSKSGQSDKKHTTNGYERFL